MSNMTETQRTTLEFFRAKADGESRTAPNLDPRTLTALRRKGHLEHVAGYYGGAHRITDAERAALKQ